jgi:hypothetical protein
MIPEIVMTTTNVPKILVTLTLDVFMIVFVVMTTMLVLMIGAIHLPVVSMIKSQILIVMTPMLVPMIGVMLPEDVLMTILHVKTTVSAQLMIVL